MLGGVANVGLIGNGVLGCAFGALTPFGFTTSSVVGLPMLYHLLPRVFALVNCLPFPVCGRGLNLGVGRMGRVTPPAPVMFENFRFAMIQLRKIIWSR
jgi:hypothetical protein